MSTIKRLNYIYNFVLSRYIANYGINGMEVNGMESSHFLFKKKKVVKEKIPCHICKKMFICLGVQVEVKIQIQRLQTKRRLRERGIF